ncbi:hypothetical protein QQ045_015604 [Rhodiola kirilowii]
MEFWGCDSEGYEYDLFSEDEELDLAVDGLNGRDKENTLIEFDLDSPFGFEEEDVMFMNKLHEVESGLSEIIGRPPEASWSVENLEVGDGIFSGDDMNVASPDCGLSSFSLLVDNESWSGNSSCGLQSNCGHLPGLSTINMEMGRQEAESYEKSKKQPEASMGNLSYVDKQPNSECLSSTKVTCQVQGCSVDLTSSKDYYKRHRVCPDDTKKAKVIVNGIQKRFCQQCSRFHLLNEFDDDKRSCRKRLAGHNKRRRKPRFENRIHRPHRFFQPYKHQGKRLHGAALPSRRHLLTDLLPARVLFPDIYDQINGLKRQGSSVYGPIHSNTPSLRPPCLGPQYYAPTVPKSSGVLDESYALSLLSNQPQVSFPYFATTSPVIIADRQIFENPANKINFLPPHMFHSSGMNLLQANQIEPRMFPGTINPVGFMVSGNDNAGSLCSNCSNGHVRRPRYGSTVNLQQLSLNLSRVEHQRNVP